MELAQQARKRASSNVQICLTKGSVRVTKGIMFVALAFSVQSRVVTITIISYLVWWMTSIIPLGSFHVRSRQAFCLLLITNCLFADVCSLAVFFERTRLVSFAGYIFVSYFQFSMFSPWWNRCFIMIIVVIWHWPSIDLLNLLSFKIIFHSRLTLWYEISRLLSVTASKWYHVVSVSVLQKVRSSGSFRSWFFDPVHTILAYVLLLQDSLIWVIWLFFLSLSIFSSWRRRF